MKKLFFTLFFGGFALGFGFAQNKLQMYDDAYLFYYPRENKGFVELAFTYNPFSFNIQKIAGEKYFVQSLNFVRIYDEHGNIVKQDSFIVKSATVSKIDSLPFFVYLKRYWLNNHQTYHISVHCKDAHPVDTFGFHSYKNIVVNFDENIIGMSDIQLIEMIEKSDNPKDIFYKYGYIVVPNTNNYVNENISELKFALEIYNADRVFGKGASYLIKYYIQDKDNNKILDKFSGFKKMKAAEVNPFIGNLSIKYLPSGNYYLVIEIIDKNNQLIKSAKRYFQRKNTIVSAISYVDDELFFGKTNNADTLKILVESLWPIANNLEKDWIINQSINKNVPMMKNFIVDFWTKRAADTTSPVKMATEYYSRVDFVMKNFKCGKMSAYYTDRGRVYLQYGPPNQRTIQLSEPGAYPYEIWQYYRIYDAVTGQFFSNKRFVFVNKSIADECYTLIHSDVRGEYNNPNWQREIMKYEIYNPNDPYQQQKLNYGNNFDKLYQNPQ